MDLKTPYQITLFKLFLFNFLTRYETLAVATDTKGKEQENMPSGKRLAADWVLGLGESASSLKILTPETESRDTPHKIVVLGARTLFVLLDTGKEGSFVNGGKQIGTFSDLPPSPLCHVPVSQKDQPLSPSWCDVIYANPDLRLWCRVYK